MSENDDLFPGDGTFLPAGDTDEWQRKYDEEIAHYLVMIPAIQAEAGPGGMAQPAGLVIAEPGKLSWGPHGASYCPRCKERPPRAGSLLQPGGIDDWLAGHARDCPVRAEWDPAFTRRALGAMPDISVRQDPEAPA